MMAEARGRRASGNGGIPGISGNSCGASHVCKRKAMHARPDGGGGGFLRGDRVEKAPDFLGASCLSAEPSQGSGRKGNLSLYGAGALLGAPSLG